MSTSKPIQVIQFHCNTADGASSCQIEVFDDGSVYVAGEDVEAGIEECPDAVERAVKYVESRGYVRCQ